jgi:YegS/Rv2252/BmrU family lipid kinase
MVAMTAVQDQATDKTTDKCVTIIFNPVSGQIPPEQREAQISEALAVHGYRCQYLYTTPEQGARHFAEVALKDGVDLLAVSGGDGTVVEAMTALIGSELPLIIFPAGTGNLLAVNLGLSLKPADVAEAALFGKRRSVDLGRISFTEGGEHYFAIMAGAGYDAAVIADADRDLKNKLGLLAYLWAALRNLRRRPVRVSLYIDGATRPLRRRVKSVMVANMGRLQGGIDFVPDAHSDDGVLDVALLKTELLTDWALLLRDALLRRLRETAAIEFHRGRRIRVELYRPELVQFDGEEARATQGFTVEVIPQAVQVMVPQETSL